MTAAPFGNGEHALIVTFGVPPYFMGHRIESVTREDAARERLAHLEAIGVDPFSVCDDDVELVVTTEGLWQIGVITNEQALARLRPLQTIP